jgi:hypothetical protein
VLAGGARRAAAQQPIDRYQILVMTMGPGKAVYERFGHNAIVVVDTVLRRDWVYNYGTFDFAQPGFVRRFVEGRPLYWLGVAGWDATLRSYQYAERRVEVQELALRPEQKAQLAFELARNAEPANREYRYDYFRDNCSTRVRDMLDRVLGGALRAGTEGRPAEGTLRFHMARSLTTDLPMYVGILAAMGPAVDRPLDQWDEMFLPAKLQERLRELRVVDPTGRDVPLVAREATVLDLDVYRVEPVPPDRRLAFAAVGLLLALVIATGVRAGRVGAVGRAVGGLWLVLAGVAGVVLALLWLATNHVATRGNRNLLLLSPLALLLVPVLWGWTRRPGYRVVALLLVGSVLLGLLLASWFALGHQVNIETALAAAPPTLASAAVAGRLTRRPV